MYYGNLFIKTGYDNIPDFSKEWKQYVFGLFKKVIEKLNSPQAYTISEQRNRLYKALELFKDDFELNKTFTDYTGDVFKAIATNQAFNPELKEDQVKMITKEFNPELYDKLERFNNGQLLFGHPIEDFEWIEYALV